MRSAREKNSKEDTKIRRVIKAVVFDFGGVLAEEGFRNGTALIAQKNGLEPDAFFAAAEGLIYSTGYVTGICEEPVFWKELKGRTGISGSDEENRQVVLRSFILREEMFNTVKRLKSSGHITAILSDQTNWLEEINSKHPFFQHFDFIFNSYRLHKSKRDPSVFHDVCSTMGIRPEEAVFVDDNINNINRASEAGLKTVHYKTFSDFEKEIRQILISSQAS